MNKSDLKKKIQKYIYELVDEKNYACSVDVLMKLGYLSEADYERWRFGKVPCLEQVCKINLSKLSFINKVIKEVGKECKLKESWTAYMKYGKGKKTRLQFSKTNNAHIEKRYATHYIKPKKQKEKAKKVSPADASKNPKT